MQTYTNNITINYNGETISLPVIHNGVDHQGINELKEYLQGILDQFPEDFLKKAILSITSRKSFVISRPVTSNS